MSTSSNVMQNQLPLHVSFRKKDPISEVNLKICFKLDDKNGMYKLHPRGNLRFEFSIILTISLNYKQTYILLKLSMTCM